MNGYEIVIADSRVPRRQDDLGGPNRMVPDEELFAPVDDEEPRILTSTPEPSGDEGLVKPDPDDD